MALYDSTGALFATYDYDAWGKVISIKDAGGNNITSDSNFAIINPIRYRGYYYDNESGLYYLQSRYYDPTTGRFVNADKIITTNTCSLHGNNLFTYCNNNPVSLMDEGGDFPIAVAAIVGFAAVGAVVGAVSSIVVQEATTHTVDWTSVTIDAASGTIMGAVSGSPLGVGSTMVIGASVGLTSYVVDVYCHKEEQSLSISGAVISTAGGLVSGYLGGAGANYGNQLANAERTCATTIARQSTRRNTNYAAKEISRALSTRNDKYCDVLLVTFFRMLLGSSFQNFVRAIDYYANEN